MARYLNIESVLQYADKSLRLRFVAQTDSTNRMLKELAAAGEEEGLAIIAEHQTAGRGRLGRSFFSPEGSGLYMSLLLRPKGAAADTVRLTTLAAVAVARAIEELSSREVGIKWVNDIYMEGKKVCGILCEAGFGSEGAQWVVIGVGVNVIEPEGGFPPELQDIAGAVFHRADAPENAREILAGTILRHLMALYREPGTYFEDYRKRLTVLGRDISVHTPQGAYPARALDVDDDCRLLIETVEGKQLWLNTGEISVRL